MAQPRLSKASNRLAKRVIESAEGVASLAKRVDDRRVKELVRRAAIPIIPDGYSSNSMPERTSGGSQSDPTFGTVLAKDKKRRDPVADDLRRLLKDLDKAESHMRAAVARLDGIDRKVEEKIERRESTPCLICLTLPATKQGMCDGDYLDWWRYGQPDQHQWRLWRTGEINSKGETLVEECPRPSEGHVAAVGPWRQKK